MHFLKNPGLLFCISLVIQVRGQDAMINILDSGKNTSLRGLSVVDDQVLWASGSNGTVVRSTNGGKTFEWLTVAGNEKRDFRDIEAFDANTAIIMTAGEPAVMLKTKDGGKTWKKVFEDSTRGMFLDAMDFDEKYGVVVGDPVNYKFFMALTKDAGDSWTINNKTAMASDSEALFAASGTNIKILWNKKSNEADIFFVTGGWKSRIFENDSPRDLDIIQGKETQGANSIGFYDKSNAVIVGGDFKNDTSQAKNCLKINLDHRTGTIEFIKPQSLPHGYRSCVSYITKDQLVTCGTSGVDISKDRGLNWELISTQSFHVCQKAKKGEIVFLAGANGKIGKLELK